MRRIFFLPTCFVAVFLPTLLARAADHSAVMPYVANDVGTIALADAAKVDIPAAFEELASLGLIPADVAPQAREQAAAAQRLVGELPGRGGRRIYTLIRSTDLLRGGTTWVVETAGPAEAAAVKELLEGWLGQVPERAIGDFTSFLPKKLRVEGSVVLGGPTEEWLDAVVKGRRASAREDAAAALAALGDADAGIVAFGDADSRRVVRELWPAAPAPFAAINGQFLADRLRWMGVMATFPPKPTVTLAIEAADAEAVGVLKGAAAGGLAALQVMELAELASDLPVHKARGAALLPLLPLLTPKVEGTRLSLTLGDDPQEVASLKSLLAPAIGNAREAASRAQRMNDFKQIALGMLNYESAKKTYPPSAIRDSAGRPLLSWRVLILPYVEQQALYNEFHLDEPWDSEHNLKLVEKMPEIYQDPDPAVRAAIGNGGRTTFVVPAGAGTIFSGNEGMKIRDVKDGTSNTALLVEVVPERAVIWTKPDDWEVDVKEPLRGVRRNDREGFTVAYADGSVRYIPNAIKPDNWLKILTAAAKDIVEYPY